MKNESGQALIILIVAMALAITILTGVTLTAVTLAKSTLLTKDSQTAYYAAESGVEYGLMKLVRNPSSCDAPAPNDDLTIDASTVTISYGLVESVCTISVTGTNGTVLKKFQVQATIANSKVTYCCWKELP